MALREIIPPQILEGLIRKLGQNQADKTDKKVVNPPEVEPRDAFGKRMLEVEKDLPSRCENMIGSQGDGHHEEGGGHIIPKGGRDFKSFGTNELDGEEFINQNDPALGNKQLAKDGFHVDKKLSNNVDPDNVDWLREDTANPEDRILGRLLGKRRRRKKPHLKKELHNKQPVTAGHEQGGAKKEDHTKKIWNAIENKYHFNQGVLNKLPDFLVSDLQKYLRLQDEVDDCFNQMVAHKKLADTGKANKYQAMKKDWQEACKKLTKYQLPGKLPQDIGDPRNESEFVRKYNLGKLDMESRIAVISYLKKIESDRQARKSLRRPSA